MMRTINSFIFLTTVAFSFNSFGEDAASTCKTCAEKEASFLNTLPSKIEKGVKELGCAVNSKDIHGHTKQECKNGKNEVNPNPAATVGVRG